MAALRVIKKLDLMKYVTPSFFPVNIDLPPDALALEELEETLSDSIVIAVSTTAHAGRQIVSLQE